MTLNLRDHVQSADFVFIDGGHTYELVKRDTENALSIIAKGGMIVWDDYWWFCPGVVSYLNELSRRLFLRRIDGTNLVVTWPLLDLRTSP